MAKYNKTTIAGQYASTTELNDNFDDISTAIENQLSRDGTTPNSMAADIDMDSNDILNGNVVNAQSVNIAGVAVVPGDTLSVPSATNVPNTPAGNIIATDVQAAINELDTEKVGLAGTETITGNKTLSGDTTVSGALSISGIETNTAQVRWAKGADVASAAALALGADGNYFDITGTTTVTSIGTLGIGTVVKLHFDAALILTYSATDLILPGAANITTAAGDEAEFVEYATGDWRCINYSPIAVAPKSRGSLVHNTGPQSVANATYVYLSFDTEEYDTSSIHNTVTNNNRLTVPTGVTKIRLSANIIWDTNSTGTRLTFFSKNDETTAPTGAVGLPTSLADAASSGSTHVNVQSAVINVTAGDYFTVAVQQTSGGALNIENDGIGNRTWFAMEIIE